LPRLYGNQPGSEQTFPQLLGLSAAAKILETHRNI